MKVVILCGGLGTRLREETEYRPKPMVEVGGRPILWHIMKIYSHYGFRDFVLCLGYRGNVIKEYFLNYEAMNSDFTLCMGSGSRVTYHDVHQEQGLRVTLAETGAETMTGGRLRRVRRYLGGETFLLTYGDGVADVDVAALVEFHKSHGKLATLTAVQPTSRFGMLNLEGSLVDEFAEKPRASGWVNAGFMVLEPPVIDWIEGDQTILESDTLVKLARQGELAAYRHTGAFHAMDTYREYTQLNELWASGNAAWRVWS